MQRHTKIFPAASGGDDSVPAPAASLARTSLPRGRRHALAGRKKVAGCRQATQQCIGIPRTKLDTAASNGFGADSDDTGQNGRILLGANCDDSPILDRMTAVGDEDRYWTE